MGCHGEYHRWYRRFEGPPRCRVASQWRDVCGGTQFSGPRSVGGSPEGSLTAYRRLGGHRWLRNRRSGSTGRKDAPPCAPVPGEPVLHPDNRAVVCSVWPAPSRVVASVVDASADAALEVEGGG